MSNESLKNPWANHNRIIKNIEANVDVNAIEKVTRELKVQAADSKRVLKGIYFDNDVAQALDELKKRRINVSGFVNDAVRKCLSLE